MTNIKNNNENSREQLFDALNKMKVWKETINCSEDTLSLDMATVKDDSQKVDLGTITNDLSTYHLEEDLVESTKQSFLDKISDKIIYLQAKMTIRSSKKERESCQLGFQNVLNFFENNQKQNRIQEMREIIKDLKIAIDDRLDEQSLKKLYDKINVLESKLKMVSLDPKIYDQCLFHITNIKTSFAKQMASFHSDPKEEPQYQMIKARKN